MQTIPIKQISARHKYATHWQTWLVLPLAVEDLELIKPRLDFFEAQQRYFHSVAEQNSHLRAKLGSFSEHSGVHPDGIIIPESTSDASAGQQALLASDAAAAKIDSLQQQLEAARDEIDALRDRASYFENMLDLHLEKSVREFGSSTLREESPRTREVIAGDSDDKFGKRIHHHLLAASSSARRGTYFGSFGGGDSPTKRMMARLDRARASQGAADGAT